MSGEWDRILQKLQEENDLFLEEVEDLLRARDREIEELRRRVEDLEARLARIESGSGAVTQLDGSAAEGREEEPVSGASLEEFARRTGRGVGEVQLMMALAERRKKRRSTGE